MLGLPPARFDFADASTLDNKIALYQLNVCLDHPCKVIEKKKFEIAYWEWSVQVFRAYLTEKEYFSSVKKNTVKYLDVKYLQLPY